MSNDDGRKRLQKQKRLQPLPKSWKRWWRLEVAGKEFQTMDAATGNERWPTVVRRYNGSGSLNVYDDRRRLKLLPRPRYIGGRGIVFDRFLCLFVCLFVCMYLWLFVSLLARLRENEWTKLHETFREGVDWPWDDLSTFFINSEKPRDAAMCNTGTGFVVL